jgi:hypothetical protein
VRKATEPFVDGEPCQWILARRSGTLADQPSTPTVVRASRRSALVTVWVEAGSRCLLDLLACGSVALDGPPVAVGATLSDVVVELATRRWSDVECLTVVGFGEELLGLQHVDCLPDIEAARQQLLAAPPAGEPGGRYRCLVVAPPVVRRSSGNLNPLRALIELAHARGDTAVVCCDPTIGLVRCIWRLESHRNAIEVGFRLPNGSSRVLRRAAAEPLGEPDRLGDTDPVGDPDLPGDRGENEVDELRGEPPVVAAAATSVEPGVLEPGVGERGVDGAAGESGAEDDEDRWSLDAAPPAVLVRVLGPVEVIGSAFSLDRRPRVSELVAYLAFHRDGCAGEAITNALWPDRRVSAQTLANRLTEARRALGENVFGAPRLRRVSGRHVLSQEVGTDWEIFESLTGPSTGAEEWHRALELVRGRPFEGLAEGDWTVLEGWTPSMCGRIVEVACRLASNRLAEGDASGAEWALRKGLLCVPWDERIYRLLMVVHDAAGNRGAIDSALHSLAHVLQVEGEPLDGVHPETAELYLELTRERESG